MTADETAAVRTSVARQEPPLEIATPEDARLHDLYGARFALIRPDQHVAWRGNQLDELDTVLDTARGVPAE